MFRFSGVPFNPRLTSALSRSLPYPDYDGVLSDSMGWIIYTSSNLLQCGFVDFYVRFSFAVEKSPHVVYFDMFENEASLFI